MDPVTICIPAYQAAPFIAETLTSVQEQTDRNLRIVVAIDPAEDSTDRTRDALTPFLSDARVHLHENEKRLGWDANIRAMLKRVDTPTFLILPHDDLLDPRYVATLRAVLENRPDASVAYCDMTFVGDTSRKLKFVDLPPDGTRDEQLLAFFLAGAEAVPWRGLTRTRAIEASGGFPVDGHGGFAVECEYALGLILHGAAVRVPKPLYRKRIHPAGTPTASSQRIALASSTAVRDAWVRHRASMLGLLDSALGCSADKQGLTRIAAETAMLRRYLQMVARRLPSKKVALAEKLLRQTNRDFENHPAAHKVAAMLHAVLSRHAFASGNNVLGKHHAARATELNAPALIRAFDFNRKP